MTIARSISTKSLLWVLENPAQFATVVIFGLGFGMVATNALVSQDGAHVSPLWHTNLQETSGFEAKPITTATNLPVQTHTVLTQRISLRNIPVPTANPAKIRPLAAQSSLVREVQSVLFDVGIYKGKVDGIFGDQTRDAILEYQKSAGIIPDGEASYGLLAHAKSAFAVAQVQAGHKDNPIPAAQPGLVVLDTDTVQKVQAGLREFYGEEEITVDGIFGNQTRHALRLFQKRFRLEVTGELDEDTLNKLREAGIVGST